MGWYVHLHVCFEARQNEGVARLARKHVDSLPIDAGEARWFLQDLSTRVGTNRGPKGGLCLWGIVGGGTKGECFAEALRPFWAELLSGHIEGGPFDHSRVVVLYEEEQSGAANAIEIAWDDWSSDARQLTMTAHRRLPFSWGQS